MQKKISDLAWVGGSQIFLLLSNFLLLKLLTGKLSFSDFGYYSLFMSIALFFRQVIYDAFSMVVAKNCSSNISDESKLSLALSALNQFLDKAAIIIASIGFILLTSFFYFADDAKLAIASILISIYLAANGAQGIYLNVLNSLGRRKIASMFSMTDSALRLAVVFLFLELFYGVYNIVLLSISISAFFIFGITRYFVDVQIARFKIDVRHVKSVLKNNIYICVPLLFPMLLNALRSIGDRWMLSALMGVNELASYSVLLQIGYLPVTLIFGVAQTYLAPRVYLLAGVENNYHALKKLVLNILLAAFIFSVVAGVVALVFNRIIFDVLVGSNYRSFSVYLPFFVMAGSFAATSGILQLIVFGCFDTKTSGKLIATSIVFSLVVTLLLIYSRGFYGAIAGLVLSGIISSFIFLNAILRKFSE